HYALPHRDLHSFPTRRSSDLQVGKGKVVRDAERQLAACMKSLQRREAARAVHGMDAGEPKPGQRRQRARHSAVEVGVGRLRLITDRKSIRLNSSHVSISYAVF